MSLTVRPGGLTFHGKPPGSLPEFRGLAIQPGGLGGWFKRPGVRRESIERPAGHGSFDMPGHLTDRLVTVDGWARARSDAELEQIGDEVAGLGADGYRFQLEVDSAAGTRWAWVRLESDAEFLIQRGGLAWPTAKVALTLWMPDPFKYGETPVQPASEGDSVTFGNVAVMSHRGNTAAHPKFTVTPTSSIGAAGYQIKGKGRTFEVPGPLNLGSTDKVDFKTGQVLRNGVAVEKVTPQRFDVGGGELAEWRLWPLSGAGKAVPHLTDTFA